MEYSYDKEILQVICTVTTGHGRLLHQWITLRKDIAQFEGQWGESFNCRAVIKSSNPGFDLGRW